MIKLYLENIKDRLTKNDKEYIFLCNAKNIYDGKGYQFIFDDDMDKQLAVFRRDGNLYCLSNICPHRHQDKIYDGIIQDLKVSCPEHGWTYELETGKNINHLQGLRSLKKYEIIEKEGKIYIEFPEFEIPKWRENL
ncbi:MAG: Rieske 2Fe-2S domain-containing protein [Ignavibacteriae bacterium]|nr:Rieske 2Fe-2S domain-containing protein [Ignavibacteriota bacterium]